jgi:hypothetical protein
MVTDGHFGLPATSIGKDDLPGQLNGQVRKSRDTRETGFCVEPQRTRGLVMSGIENREGNDTCFAFTSMPGIPDA